MNQRYVLYAISWLSTVSAGVAATLFSGYLPLIVKELTGSSERATIAQVGSAAGAAFLLGWAVGAVLLGMLGDKIGRKRALLLSVATCTLGIVATSFVQSVEQLIAIRVITGAGAGSILLLTAVMVSEAWANGNRARVVGILINAFPVGFILSGIIGANVPDFRTAYLVGGVTVLLVFAVQFFIKESELWGKVAVAKLPTKVSVFDQNHRKDLAIATMLFGSMLVGLWAVFVWMPTWIGSISTQIQAQHNRSITNMMLGGGSVVGGFISGFVSNAIGRRRAASIGYVGCFSVTALVFLIPLQPGLLLFSLTFLLSIFIGLNQGVLSAYITELFPTSIRAFATGISFNTGRLLTVVAVVFMGVLVPLLNGYHNAMFVFSAAYLIGLFTLRWARETRGIPLPE
ncbi:MAG: MFS transporter [Ignavibacteria bacterium]|nr:MFS transporter [Ignavibacteria bacterium]